MIERTYPHSPPAIPRTNAERWAAIKPLYDLCRNAEAYEYERTEILDNSEPSLSERAWA